jgi:hypothetical protein
MHRGLFTAFIASLALGLIGPASVFAAGSLTPVSLQVPPPPSTSGNLLINVTPHARLPAGGYYYAVAVLQNYPRYSSQAPPSCAISSDMSKAQYGFPQREHPLQLSLTPALSPQGRWCPGTYVGAVYAVPHKPRCTGGYACSQKSNQALQGVVANPAVPGSPPEGKPYSYPGGIPTPLDRSARLVGRFFVEFVVAATPPGQHPVPVDGPICPRWATSLPCQCPEGPTPSVPARGLPTGFGWVELTLAYSASPQLPDSGSCPGGVAIESQSGIAVASAGYTEGPPGGPGLASGSVTDFVLAPGAWQALARAGREPFTSAAFTVAAGHATKLTIHLP